MGAGFCCAARVLRMSAEEVPEATPISCTWLGRTRSSTASKNVASSRVMAPAIQAGCLSQSSAMRAAPGVFPMGNRVAGAGA